MNEIARNIEANAEVLTTRTKRGGLARRLWSALTVSPIATFGGAIVAFWCLSALLAPWIAPYSPTAQDIEAMADSAPTAKHLLGVDPLGRDILSRILWGARTVLTVAPVAVLGAAILGTLLGLLSGYRGGLIDALIMRSGDTILAFPVIILYLIVIVKFGASALMIIAIITLTKAPIIARIVRGVTLDVKNRDYVAAARMRGESTLYIMLAEILPQARGPLIVDFFLRLGYTTILIGVLGFLGVGLPPPNPDWGSMIKEAYGRIYDAPHMTIFPSIAVSSLVIGFNFLATGIREAALDD